MLTIIHVALKATVFYRTALDLLHCKYIESYSAIWRHIALLVSHCTCLHISQSYDTARKHVLHIPQASVVQTYRHDHVNKICYSGTEFIPSKGFASTISFC